MTGLLAALAMQSAGIATVFVPVPDAADLTVQALVRVPKLSDAERLCLRAGWDTLLEGSIAYGKPTLRKYMQQTGKPVIAKYLGDHLFLRVSFPPNQVNTAIAMLDSLLREPSLEAADLERALEELKEPKSNSWSAALDPERWREAKPTRAEVLTTFRRIVRPENLLLAFGGAVEPDSIRSALRRFNDWSPSPERGFVRSWGATATIALASPDGTGIVELYGREFPASDPNLAAHLLGVVALGGGKNSALYRFAREEMGWSYRQEGFLQPTPGGLQMRLMLAHSGSDDFGGKVEPLRQGLLKQVEGWNESDRLRAIQNLKSYFEAGIGTAPIRLFPEGGIIATVEERTHLAAWWQMKFGEAFQPESIVRRIEAVPLSKLKQVAKEAVAVSSGRILVKGSRAFAGEPRERNR